VLKVINIGGNSYYEEDVRFARAVLADSPGVMVRQPLARVGSLWRGWTITRSTGRKWRSSLGFGSGSGRIEILRRTSRGAVLHYLDRVLGEASVS
jgi:hypothetical protein